MLTFKRSQTTDNIAIIDDPTGGYNDGKILHLEPGAVDAPLSKKRIELEVSNGDESFRVFPTVKPERLYCWGPNGSGKSFVAGKYCESYNMIYPKNKIIMFSPHQADAAYANVKNLIIMDLNDPELFAKPLDITRLSNCLVIFDDCDSAQDKKSKLWLDNFEKTLILNGRKYGIYVLSIAHMAMNGASTRHKIAEANRVIFFPHAGSSYHIVRFLTVYQGLSKPQIAAIMALKSRWVCLSASYPQYVLYDKGCYLLK